MENFIKTIPKLSIFLLSPIHLRRLISARMPLKKETSTPAISDKITALLNIPAYITDV